MNNELPTIWLVVSGIFFLMGIIAFGATIAALLKMMKLADEMKPKIDALTSDVRALTVKLDQVADRVEATMTSVQTSVDGFGGKAQGIIGTVDTVIRGISSRVEGVGPIITGALAAYKIFSTMKAHREHAKAEAGVKELPAKPAAKKKGR